MGGQSLVDRQPMEGVAQTHKGWGCLHSGTWSWVIPSPVCLSLTWQFASGSVAPRSRSP